MVTHGVVLIIILTVITVEVMALALARSLETMTETLSDRMDAIDYTLAQTCALQLWLRSRQDYAATMRDYVALCRRGGEAPFQELARSAGVKSPFVHGCLKDVVAEAWDWLDRAKA